MVCRREKILAALLRGLSRAEDEGEGKERGEAARREERRWLLQSGAAAELTAMRERGETWGENFDMGAAVR